MNAPRVDAAIDLADSVIGIIAEVTRYPRSILHLDADLEEELGIESVKRAEILSVLSARLSIAAPADMPLGNVKTIADVIAVVEKLGGTALPADSGRVFDTASHAAGEAIASREAPVETGAPSPREPATPPARQARTSPERETGAPPERQAGAPPERLGDDLAETVLATIAEVTRYPRSILVPEADLEEELGIESVKRAEILSVLASRLGFAVPTDAPLPKIRTIADVVTGVAQLMGDARPDSRAVFSPAALRAPRSAEENTTFEAPAGPKVETRSTHVSRRNVGRPLEGKVALVLHSGTGPGSAIAMHLASLGAAVAVNCAEGLSEGDRLAGALAAAGHRAMHAPGCMWDPEQVPPAIAEIEARFGRLDFLVSAAIHEPTGKLTTVSQADWERAFRTEVVGLQQAAFVCAPLMARGGGGKIVALSHPGARVCFEGHGLSGTVKAAVESLTRYLALELGTRGIQANTVSAGPLGGADAAQPGPASLVREWESRVPGRRLASAEDVANAVAFLLADESGMVTGSTLVVDGGLSIVS